METSQYKLKCLVRQCATTSRPTEIHRLRFLKIAQKKILNSISIVKWYLRKHKKRKPKLPFLTRQLTTYIQNGLIP